MNYDFRKNWNTILLPLIQLPIMQKAIKTGIIEFIDSDNACVGEKYSSKKPPVA